MIEQKLYTVGEVSKISTLVSDDSLDRIFLVRGKSSYKNSGAESFIKKYLDTNIIDSYYDFDSNPQIADLKKGVELFKKEKYQIIIAIGGGSVLDMAKLISVFAHQPDDIED